MHSDGQRLRGTVDNQWLAFTGLRLVFLACVNCWTLTIENRIRRMTFSYRLKVI
jgi:hypothetical protein